MAKIDQLLKFLVEKRGSDLHVKTGLPPLVRIDGELQKMKLPEMKADQVKALAMEFMPERNRKEWEATNDTDFCYELEGLGRFRTNIYRDIHGPGICQRLIPFEIMTVDDLGLSEAIRKLALMPKGIVLCTGPTGCGKTTTMAALLRYANQRRKDHIITIEDPVEYVHANEGCIVSHREVGTHTESFKRALRAALRAIWRRRPWPSSARRPATWCSPRSTPPRRPARWTGSLTSSRRTSRTRSASCCPTRLSA
jgi:twitching motility protein PilT